VLDRHGAGAIVVNAFEYVSGTLYPLIPALADPAETEWSLVYHDPRALVFLRRPPPGVPVLDKAQVADHLEAECSTYIEKDPELSLCARTLGFLFLRAGARQRAQRNFELYLAHVPGPDAEAEAAYRRASAR
jgi:hypothetical protein